MVRISKEFRDKISLVLTEHGWSRQRACIASGIPGATIGRMAMGIVPGKDYVIKWAEALREPIPVELCLPPPEVRDEIIRLLKNAGGL